MGSKTMAEPAPESPAKKGRARRVRKNLRQGMALAWAASPRLKDLDPEALRSRVGVLFQDYASYELTVRENVVMGPPDVKVDDERVMEALQDARSEWLVKKMPNGLDSKVGRLFEGGHDL